MPPKYLTLIRHGQAYHNATGDHTLLDPALTPLGISQCQNLNDTFLLPASSSSSTSNTNSDGSGIGTPTTSAQIPAPVSDSTPLPPPPSSLVSSPLTRTLQTTLISFSDFLKAYPTLKIIPLAELQETADIPCDTGREASILHREFSGKGSLGPVELGLSRSSQGGTNPIAVDRETDTGAGGAYDRIAWEYLSPEFPSKQGRWAAEKETLVERARAARKWVWERSEEHVVCVLHGGFLHFLTEDWGGCDEKHGTGWYNTEYRTYEFLPQKEGGSKKMYSIKETEGSKRRRKEAGFGLNKPLGKTEKMEYEETVKEGEGKERELKS